MAAIAVVAVVVVVLVVVLVKVTGGGSSSGANGLRPPAVTTASPAVLQEVENVPNSVLSAVGTGGSNAYPPSVERHQPLLHLNGSSKPAALYIGGVFCPYCAATRWALLVAFSKFGSFSGVQETTSSPWDVYPDTPTFDFLHATYQSPYVNFVPVEYLSQDKDGVDTHTVLQPLTAAEQRVYSTYDPQEGVPFVDIGNLVIFKSAPIDPQLLDGKTQAQVAALLRDPNSPMTQAIVGTANYMIAGVCAIDGGQPGAICTNSGVQAAAKALGIS
jgi:hypothetical protein